MTRREKLEYVQAGLRSYATLNRESQKRTSAAEWIALKLSCSVNEALRLIHATQSQNQHP